MKIKIKSRPEDFVVEEIADLALDKRGQFGVYLLKKTGWNTVELLKEISRRKDVSSKDFSYGARKDRHALTTQHITVKSPIDLSLSEDRYSLKFIGRMSRPMGPDLIRANRFKVTVRDLSEKEAEFALSQAGLVKEHGFANYFDDQRFGSFDRRQGFLAEKALKKQFNGALKIYLTSIRPEDSAGEKERKSFFFSHWLDWKECLLKARTRTERECFSFLVNKPKGFLELLKMIPREELAAYFSCFQAFLWNEVLRRMILEAAGGVIKKYPGEAGEYLFDAQPQKVPCDIDKLFIPVCGIKPEFPDEKMKLIYFRVLEENGLRQPLFGAMKLRQAYMKSFLRKANVKPEGFIFESCDDELHKNRKKLVLDFELARGSFGTMLLKRLFAQ